MNKKRVSAATAVVITILISGCGITQGEGMSAADRKTAEKVVESTQDDTAGSGAESAAGSFQIKNHIDQTLTNQSLPNRSPTGQSRHDLSAIPILNGQPSSDSTTHNAANSASTADSSAPYNSSAPPNSSTSSNHLMEQASPETSAMTLYTYDGKKVRIAYLFDSAEEQKILESLNSVKATRVKSWSADNAALPVYGIEIGRKDGFSIFAAWTNGRWIAQDGSVYQLDFDFEQLSENGNWEDAGELPSFTSFPCARLFTQENGGWNTRFLVPAAPLNPPGGVTMTLDSWNQDVAEVTISNKSGQEWGCGEFYELQVSVDGTWYEVPAIPGNWGFNCMGFYVPDGESLGMVNHVAMYGQLPPGNYRLVLNELSVDHKIQWHQPSDHTFWNV